MDQIPKSPIRREMPNPTTKQMRDPLFTVIWKVIKTWDVNVPEYYEGYCGANGSHVMLLYNALMRLAEEQKAGSLEELVYVSIGHASMCWSERPTGVFDSAEARKVAEALLNGIKEHEQAVVERERSYHGVGSDIVVRKG